MNHNGHAAGLDSAGAVIRMIRVTKGLTQPEFAEIFGISADTIGRWEHNRYRPDAAQITVLAIMAAPDDPAPVIARLTELCLVEVDKFTVPRKPVANLDSEPFISSFCEHDCNPDIFTPCEHRGCVCYEASHDRYRFREYFRARRPHYGIIPGIYAATHLSAYQELPQALLPQHFHEHPHPSDSWGYEKVVRIGDRWLPITDMRVRRQYLTLTGPEPGSVGW